MTDQEIDEILQSILKLGRDDIVPGQINRAIYRLDLIDGDDFFKFLGGIALLGHPDFGKNLTVKQAVEILKKDNKI